MRVEEAERLYTVEQAAEHLQVQPETVRRWLRGGRIHGVRLGGRRVGWRIRLSDLEAFVDERPARPDDDAAS
jgi:excisionase family DNA binding protein